MPTILLSVYSIHRDPLLVRADSQRGIAVITDALCRVLDHVQDMQCVLYEIYVQRKLVCVSWCACLMQDGSKTSAEYKECI